MRLGYVRRAVHDSMDSIPAHSSLPRIKDLQVSRTATGEDVIDHQGDAHSDSKRRCILTGLR
jgi:hypothetical protein